MKKIAIRLENVFTVWPILLLGAVLRVLNLGGRDFWYDEAFTGVVVSESWPRMMDMIVRDVHPPLYYFITKIVASFFSYGVVGIRLSAVLFGIAGVIMAYLLAKYLFGKRAGLAAALVTAISPFAVLYSQEARMYAQLGFFIVASAYFLFRSLNERKVVFTVLWGVFLGLSLLTHYLAVLFIPVFVVVVLIWRAPAVASTTGNLHHWKNALTGFGVALLIILPWIGTAIGQYKNVGPGELSWISPSRPVDAGILVQSFFVGAPPGNLTIGASVPASHIRGIPNPIAYTVISAVVLLATYTVIRKKGRPGIAVVLFFFGPIVILFGASVAGSHYFVARYLLPSAYFAYIFVAVWASALPQIGRYVVFTLFVAGILFTVRDAAPNYWNSLAREFVPGTQETAYILSPFDYVMAKYYLGKDHVVLFNADDPASRPTTWAAIGDDLRSTADAVELTGKSAIIITFYRLDIENEIPESLSALTFDRVGQYDSLFLFTAQ